MRKANNPDTSTKQSDKHFDAVESGAHSPGKPIEHKEGDGFHSGRKLPKPEEVREVSRDDNAGAAVAAAKRQNENDEKEGSVNQVPAGREYLTRTHGHK
jgi:hypothetical protein